MWLMVSKLTRQDSGLLVFGYRQCVDLTTRGRETGTQCDWGRKTAQLIVLRNQRCCEPGDGSRFFDDGLGHFL